MPRSPRIDFPGAWHHVMNRGARRGDCFEDDAHCVLFLGILGDVVRELELEVHAFALLPNHFHLLVRSVRGNMSRAMQRLCGRYTHRLNAREGWDGPTFRGRFRSQLIEDLSYLREVVAYIHLNPVRARLVSRPDEECWTSHRAHLGLEPGPRWLSRAMVSEAFGSPEQLAAHVKALHGHAEPWPEGMDLETGWLMRLRPPPRATEHPGGPEIPMADPRLVLDRVMEVTGASLTELRTARRGRRANPARRFAIWMLSRHTDLTHIRIGQHLEASPRQVANVLHRIRHLGAPPELERWLSVWDTSPWPGAS